MLAPRLFPSLFLLATAALVLACSTKTDDPAGSGGNDTTDSSTSEGGGDTDPATGSASGGDSDSATSTSGSATDGGPPPATDGASGGSSGGGGFIDPPDGGVVGQCDPGLQDCPGADEKCTAFATMPGTCCVDANKCVPVTGNGVAGEDCERTADNDDCAKGFFCTTQTSGSTGPGFCEQLCMAGDDASCDMGQCIVYNDGTLPLCRTECDPLVQDCLQGFGCFPGSDDLFVCGKPANNQGEGDDGSTCYTLRSCLPGMACVTGTFTAGCATDGSCCTPFCDLTGADPCTEATEDCVAWFTEGNAPPGHEDVGACTIPQ